MRMIIIAVAALAVLGGGGAGAYFYFLNPAEAASDASEDHKEVKEEEHVDTSHHEFVELDALVLPIIDEDGVSQTVSLVLTLEVPDSASAATVDKMKPKLKDAYIQDMYGVLNKHAALKGGVIQVGMLKKRLNRISEKVAGEDVIYDVLLQVVQQRPI